jgi:hypothetical protein
VADIAPSRVFAAGASRGEQLLEGGIEAAQSFDPILTQQFREANVGEFQGIWLNRETPYTQFHDTDLAIYFRRNADVTGRVVGEEVQHAIDFTMGATRPQIAAEAAARGIADTDVVQWWHRRVFTRQLQNIHSDQYGMGLLRPYVNDVYRAYQQQGGSLTLDEILTSQYNGLY